ncbi:MAG: hypothetical protein U5J62_09510 [Desulfurivibrio sp.]|nr:hypothetical protein [Desulfurivibrio sp.]
MIVLDTHIWVRWLDQLINPLPATISQHIASADQLAASAVSCWEVAWLARRERLQFAIPLTEWLEQALNGSGVICHTDRYPDRDPGGDRAGASPRSGRPLISPRLSSTRLG